MKKLILNLITSLISNIILSGALLVGALSFFTGRFPPDFGTLKQGLQGLQELKKATEIQRSQSKQEALAHVDPDLADIQELQARGRTQAKAAEDIQKPFEPAPPPSQMATASQAINNSSASPSPNPPPPDLAEKVRELERRILQLQTQQGRFEEKLNSLR